ncbi:tetratricopeptide repeat protein [Streptomyces sp. NPDC049879]|uniref:tetratricopeptide repeat protein n=1 Tax=Streptomyces sp. NPDC049879 TaxID=3365598 RepID=UPI0037A15AD5
MTGRGAPPPGQGDHTRQDGRASGDAQLNQAAGDQRFTYVLGNQYVGDGAPEDTGSRLAWPVRLGTVPPPATAFQDRTGVRERIGRAHAGGGTVVLTQVLSGGGGVGKTQLAARHAHEAQRNGTDLVVWIDASETAQVVNAYARATHRLGLPREDGQDAETDARVFLDWLAGTRQSWLVVLDDVTDPESMSGWWPPTPSTGNGRVVATTRRRDAILSGGGRTLIDIDTYTPDEAVAYLRDRLAQAGEPHLLDDAAAALAEDLGRLPLALAHAAAYMVNQGTTSRQYRALLADSRRRIDGLMAPGGDGYHRQVASGLLLSLDAADREEPAGLAVPVLRLAAHLDPAGHPRGVWGSEPVTRHLTAYRGGAPVTPAEALAAVRVLHRYGMLTDQPTDGPRAIRIHALTARAVRETTPPDVLADTAEALAEALCAIWPREHHLDPALSAVLRSNTDVLHQHAGETLWSEAGGGHLVLFQSGNSLHDAGLHAAAVRYWTPLAATAVRLLGPDHPDTLTIRSNLAISSRDAGRQAEAIALAEQVTADRERLFGPDSPQVFTSRSVLAICYRRAGRHEDAIRLHTEVVAGRERVLGPDHPDTLGSRVSLGYTYWDMGLLDEAIAIEEQVAADRERLLGPDDPNTLTIRSNLAISYRDAGRQEEALRLMEQVVADSARVLGDDHPETLDVRSSLAVTYRRAGRHDEAVRLHEEVAAAGERVLGPDHPDTLGMRGTLAFTYWAAGRFDEAIALEERVAADRARIIGPDHPHTVTTRHNLAISYRDAGRLPEAVALAEQVVADRARILGPDHRDTLASRGSLGIAYRRAGWFDESVRVLADVAADHERVLGPDHPDTLGARSSLAHTHWAAGRAAEAIVMEERVVADRTRVLGPDHAETFIARHNLAISYRDAGRLADALALMRAIVADRERVLGPDAAETRLAVDILRGWTGEERKAGRRRRRWWWPGR